MYTQSCQTSNIECLAILFSSLSRYFIFAKRSILEVWQNAELQMKEIAKSMKINLVSEPISRKKKDY